MAPVPVSYTHLEGDRGSLIFGTAKQNYDDFGNFFGLELSAKDGNFYIKLFQDGGAGGELVDVYKRQK